MGGVGVDPSRFVRWRGRFGGSVFLPQRSKWIYTRGADIRDSGRGGRFSVSTTVRVRDASKTTPHKTLTHERRAG